MTRSLLQVEDLAVRFHTPEGVVHAVNGISYSIDSGETLGIVGESGCGKSVSVLSLLQLLPVPPAEIHSGRAVFIERDLLGLSSAEMCHVRGKEIGMVYQDPMTSLNPVLTVGFQIVEALQHYHGISRREADSRAAGLLDMVGIPRAVDRLRDYPHQFSGGMRQRAMIAMALCGTPKLLIADEPTTALDVTIQAQIIALVRRLQDEMGMAVIWITHDLGVVARVVKRVIVMYAGHIAEQAPVGQLFKSPGHPYTVGLLRSLPRLDSPRGAALLSIPGQPPSQLGVLHGCPFFPRCSFKVERCETEMPDTREIGDRHLAACWQTDSVRKR
jgi:oligopeptide transport system ATP-binding protein